MERCDCDKHESLNLYIDGQLTEEETLELLAHVENCRICELKLAELRYMKEVLSNIPDLELPLGYHEELMIKLDRSVLREKANIIKIDFRRIASAAAGIFLAFTLMSVIITALNSAGFGRELNEYVQMATVEESSDNAYDVPQMDASGSELINIAPFSVDQIIFGESQINSSADEAGAASTAEKILSAISPRNGTHEYSRRRYSVNIDTEDISAASAVINTLSGINTHSRRFEYGQNKSLEITRLVSAEGIDYCMEALRGIGIITFEEESNVMTEDAVRDIETRLNAKHVESERLLKILEASQTVEALAQVSARLEQVIEEIDSYESDLRSYLQDSKMLTVNIIVSEKVSSEAISADFSQRLSSRFNGTLIVVTEFMENFLVWLAFASAPIVTLSAAVFVIFLVRRLRTRPY